MEESTYVPQHNMQSHWNNWELSGNYQGSQDYNDSRHISSHNWKGYRKVDNYSQYDNGSYYEGQYDDQCFKSCEWRPAQRQWQSYSYSPYRRKPITCPPCNRTFYCQQRYEEHMEDHVDCPFPECKLSAHVKVIDQHINNQHMLVNFASLQIDDETWIAERKKRFPTAERAKLRRAEQMEKLKRGEKLGFKNKPFSHKNDNSNFSRKSFDKHRFDRHGRDEKDHNKTKYRDDRRKDTTAKPLGIRKPFVEVDLFELSDEEKYGVKPFKGTKEYLESTGEMTYFSELHEHNTHSENDIAISDEEEWECEYKDDKQQGALVLGGALGSLMGTYSDSEEEEDEKEKLMLSPAATAKKMKSLVVMGTVGTSKDENTGSKPCSNTKEPLGMTRKRKRTHRKSKASTSFKRPYRPFPTRKRKSLLERLLKGDIIHERNIILQCIRYIVENNFFSSNVKVGCSNDEATMSQDRHISVQEFQQDLEVIGMKISQKP
ncbi:hypothetical protein SK128_017182 [Halocaridina rubra]|uniref:C2H2-type domain-containing protein n=1 Tax=Halocaridina rubra TaxID=373956 RepID=A0AAN9A5V0_HALRR